MEDFSNKTPFSENAYNILGAYRYNHINVTKFSKLAEDIITLYGKTSKDYINELSKVIAMYQAIKKLRDKKSLCAFEKQSKSIEFIDLALTEIAELKKSNISSEKLLEISEDFPENLRNKSVDMASIYSYYENILQSKNLQDSLSDILECNRLAIENDCFKDTIFFIDEFDAFTNDELQLLNTIFSQCKDFYVSLRTDNPLNTRPNQFETVNKTYRQLLELANNNNQECSNIECTIPYRYNSIGLKTLSSDIFNHRVNSEKVSCCGDVSITECIDYYQECDFVCSQIRNLVLENKYTYNDIFVTARHVDDYLGIIERAFEKYDIPYFLSTDKSSIYTSIMVYFVNLLEILSSKKFNTDDILRYIKNPINNLQFQEIADLENYCYMWNVKGNMWLEPFIESENSTADSTRQNIIMPLLNLKERIKNKTCLEVCREIFIFMDKNSIMKNIQTIIDNNRANGLETVADEMVRIWDMLMTILDTLCNFMGDTVLDIKEFKNVICCMINQSKFKIAPQKLDAVSFSASDNARFNSPKIVFVLGVNDGVFPSAVSNSGLFSNSDMEYFSKKGLTFSKSLQDKTADEKLVVYKTLSAPSQKIFLSYALKNTMGDIKYPSYVVDSVKNLFNDLTIKTYNDVPISEVCSTLKSSYDYFVRNFWNNSNDRTTIESVLRLNDIYTSKLDYLQEISNNTQLKIQDNQLALDLFKRKIKIYATKFETYNKCHFKYFCSEGLNIFKPMKKVISKSEIGNIIHYCLENIIKNNEKEKFINLTQEEISAQIENSANEYKAEHLGGNYGKDERFEANFKRVKNSILYTVQHLQEEFKQLQFTPEAFELSIDDKKNCCPPLAIKNSAGMELFLCGKVDRVDVLRTDNENFVRVVDYKSGNQKFETEKLPYGIDMQMFLYLFAIIGTNGSDYYDFTPAGVLYMPVSEIQIDNKRSDIKKDVLDTTNKHFRMKGVVLDDKEVIKCMEQDLKGVYIPFKENSKKKSNNMVLSKEQFNLIKEHAEKLLIDMANGLSTGDISAKALIFANEDEKFSVCSYCDYWSICGNYPHRDCNLVEKEDAQKQYEKIIGEEVDE